jgi:presenilin-like A22 family membrane protease
MRAYGIIPALLIIFGALLGLSFLFMITKKGKAYPAMPYISVGIFLGMLIGVLTGQIPFA